MGSKPEREDETPSTGINWKLFLLVAGIIGIAFFAGMMMQSDGDSAPADVNSPDAIGQSGGSKSPAAAVEPDTEPTTTQNPTNKNEYIEDLPDVVEIASLISSRQSYRKSNFANCRITDMKEEDHKISFYIENNGGYPMQIWQLDIKAPCGTSIHFFNDIEIAGNEKKYFVTKDLRECDGVHFPVKNIIITVV